jgi:hypothetical protein
MLLEGARDAVISQQLELCHLPAARVSEPRPLTHIRRRSLAVQHAAKPLCDYWT